MNWWEIIITIFVLGGILYNFEQSAEERGIDLFGCLYGIVRMIILLPLYPIVMVIERYKNNRRQP